MLHAKIRELYGLYGQRKSMGVSSPSTELPHFFLLRTFLGENDLLIILNSKRCAYQCHFCQLPAKSSKVYIGEDELLAQLDYVFNEVKHSLSILDRITLSNEGSVLDSTTLPVPVLFELARCLTEMRRVQSLVLETRLEYVDINVLQEIKKIAPRLKIDILTGFETQNIEIREKILGKKETLSQFEQGLDKLANAGVNMTAYVLFKPSYLMTDDEAIDEATQSIEYIKKECGKRGLSYTIRLNPMYSAKGSRWELFAQKTVHYKPPRLTDILRLAKTVRNAGGNIYIGLSTENLDDGYTYKSREDYSRTLLHDAVNFNNQFRLREFEMIDQE